MEFKKSVAFLILIFSLLQIIFATQEQYFISTNHNRWRIPEETDHNNNWQHVPHSQVKLNHVPQLRGFANGDNNNYDVQKSSPVFKQQQRVISPKFQPHPQNIIQDNESLPKRGQNKIVLISSRQEKPAEKSNNLPRRPGLPNDIPLPTINASNVAALLALASNDSTDPANLTFEQELLVLQTFGEIANFIGLQDMRDWLGMVFMFFVSGPVLIPMFWLPIMLIIMAAFMIPLVINGAGIAAAAAVAAEGGAGVLVGRKQNQFPATPLESYCLEMLSCEVTNFMRSSKWSNWVTRAFKLTSVEWAGRISKSQIQKNDNPFFTQEEDCMKYRCKIIAPLQRFFSNWYSYLFTFQQFPVSNNNSKPSGGTVNTASASAASSAKNKRKKVG